MTYIELDESLQEMEYLLKEVKKEWMRLQDYTIVDPERCQTAMIKMEREIVNSIKAM